MNEPNEAGLYWGRSNPKMQWYDLIIEIAGEAPMLYIRCVYSRLDDKVYTAKPHDVLIGPRVDMPKVPKEDIKL